MPFVAAPKLKASQIEAARKLGQAGSAAILAATGIINFETAIVDFRQIDSAFALLQRLCRGTGRNRNVRSIRGVKNSKPMVRSAAFTTAELHTLAHFIVLGRPSKVQLFAYLLDFVKAQRSLTGLESLFVSGLYAAASFSDITLPDGRGAGDLFGDGADLLNELSGSGIDSNFSSFPFFDSDSEVISFMSGGALDPTATDGLMGIVASAGDMVHGIDQVAGDNPAIDPTADDNGSGGASDDGKQGAEGSGGGPPADAPPPAPDPGPDSDGRGTADVNSAGLLCQVGAVLGGASIGSKGGEIGLVIGIVGGLVAAATLCTGSKPAPGSSPPSSKDSGPDDGPGQNDNRSIISNTFPVGPGLASYVSAIGSRPGSYVLHGMPQFSDDGSRLDNLGMLVAVPGLDPKGKLTPLETGKQANVGPSPTVINPRTIGTGEGWRQIGVGMAQALIASGHLAAKP
jgi:hypothetical protein